MGLQLTLAKDKNKMYYDFINAYWAIDNVYYTTDNVAFALKAYPNRESKQMDLHTLDNPSIGYGSGADTVDSSIYLWSVVANLDDVFSNGVIPQGRDAQYTAIYNWIKAYTRLPFTDVFES